ncbi:protocadherin gamma-C5 isoform X2 [Oncorhynchus kisutch]|uniref:protocadherin gamma-C5 isoform X2 n=1 Tax=Oncorhynchus kisutch TaxID=8019 RepID=UPI0012DFB81F|nr:protocadherin gamma-C5-like isoform X2 [Oncorhynchus kisutch]
MYCNPRTSFASEIISSLEMGILGMKILRKRAFWLFFLLWNTIQAQIRYTIPEELKEGAVVGNIAEDLGLKASEIFVRKLRIASEAGKQYFSVDLRRGELVVNERIDRESLCGQSASCLLPLQVVIEEPLQLYRVEVEVQDINDNGPIFLSTERVLNVAESTTTGARFLLTSAKDPDVGSNSLSSYKLNKNDFFSLNVKTNRDGTKIPELILQKALDREKQAVHHLVLTAIDGGNPVRSGTTEVTVQVLDNNDNAPIFEKSLYECSLLENSPKSTVVIIVKAGDTDEGANGAMQYTFAEQTPDFIHEMFSIDSESGQITLTANLDYEESHTYEFNIRATDKGIPAMEGHCSIRVEILDVNDNAPEIVLTSLPNPVKEDASLGTVVALIGAKDLDSVENGKVSLSLIGEHPFKLKPSYADNYAILTDSELDRELFSEYKLKIIASDSGSPPLTSKKELIVRVLDVNDNPPVFSQPSYTVYVRENNAAGSIMCSVSASDPDIGENAKISYSILDSKVHDVSVSSYIYINSDNGSIYSMHSFDYEKLKVFQIQVQAKDHGSPSLSSNVTVHVFILDQNDNAPAVIYPSVVMGSVSHQKMPRSAKAGHLTTKISAVDADSGHNAWISYRLEEATDSSLFSVNLYTGEVRTKRAVSEQDDSTQRLLIEIQDNGEPVQSATVTVNILLEDGLHEPISDFRQKTAEPSKINSKITFYLIISLASVSVMSLLTFLILVVKCVRNSRSSSSCCIRRADSDGYKNPNRNLQLQLNTDGPIKYVEVLGGDMLSQSQSFRSCLSPVSEFSDFTLVKPSSTTDFQDMINVLDASLPDSAWTFESQQQKPPNNDWRFTQQGQRPGPSGQYRLVPHYSTQRSNNTGTTDRQNNGTYRYSTSTQQRWTPYGKARAGPHPEGAGGAIVGTGPWPNPPTEAEQLQALMAAANEVSEATATLGPRYNAQFPMQHVPDYRQNVYIPGSTATLTANPQQMMPQPALQGPPQAMPQVDVPNAAQTPASKKKSTKKDKK